MFPITLVSKWSTFCTKFLNALLRHTKGYLEQNFSSSYLESSKQDNEFDWLRSGQQVTKLPHRQIYIKIAFQTCTAPCLSLRFRLFPLDLVINQPLNFSSGNHRKPILQISRKISSSRNHFPFFHISLCVVLLSSLRLHSQPIRVVIHEIKNFEWSTRKQGSEK